MRQFRRILESDLSLPALSLDETAPKAAVAQQVDAALETLLQLEDEGQAQEADAQNTAPKAKQPRKGGGGDADPAAAVNGASAAPARPAAPAAPSAAAAPRGGASAAPPDAAEELSKALQRVAKAAGLATAHLHKGTGGDAAQLATKLRALLAAEGLSATSGAAAIKAVRERKDLAKEMDGIDAGAIIEGGRARRGGGAAAGAPVAPKAVTAGAAAATAPAPGPAKRGRVIVDSDDD